MYDEVWWEAELPEGHPPESRLFQTKAFTRCLDRYVITRDGRLVLVGNGWQDDDPFTGRKEGQRGVDTEFHGDIRVVSLEGEQGQYIVRFTHGTLEWVRPLADAPRLVSGL